MCQRPSFPSEMTDLLGRDGRIVRICDAQAARLGVAPGAVVGQPWGALYPMASRERLEQLLAQADPGPHVLQLELRLADGGVLDTTAIVTMGEDKEAGPCLRTVKWATNGALQDIARLTEENTLRAAILEASNDAGWCMEWTEPVDLSAPEQEIIRQVFENGPRWRFCNGAMARLYRTPEGEDFNRRPVREVFARSPENEAFVRRLIHADFQIDGSPSRDLRYDGVYIEVENDVRGHIRGNKLYRMWGSVRDVSRYARRSAVLSERIGMLEDMLDGLPDALLILSRAGEILHANQAAEELFALPREVLHERALADVLTDAPAPEDLFALADERVPGRPARMLPVQLRMDGRQAAAALAVRDLSLRGEECIAISLRLRLRAAQEDAPAARGGRAG